MVQGSSKFFKTIRERSSALHCHGFSSFKKNTPEDLTPTFNLKTLTFLCCPAIIVDNKKQEIVSVRI